jgi:DNA repair exonuclease SbcCD ATPase subunit
VGIVAKNGHGKSSLIDSILYGIYGKFSRGERYQAVNINRTRGESYVKLKINNHDFEIQRKIVCNKKNSYEIKFMEDGKTITDDEKILTSKLVDDKISPYDDLINTSIILQYGDNFLDLDSLKKKEYICRLLGLDVINLIIKKAKFQTNSLRQTILQYQKDLNKYNCLNLDNKTKEMNDIKLQQKRINKMLIKTEVKLEKNKEKIIRLGLDKLSDESYIDVKIQREKIQEEIKYLNKNQNQNKNELEAEINELSKSIKNLEITELNQYDKIKQQFDDLTQQHNKCKSKMDEINHRGLVIPNDPELEDKYNKLTENYEINNSLIKNKKELKNVIKKISELENHIYNESCDACMSNPVTKQKLYLEKEKNEIELAIKNLKLKLHQDISDSIQEEYNNYQQLIKQIIQDQQEIVNLQKDDQLYLNLLDQLSHRLNNCNKLREQQDQNMINTEKIKKLKKKLKNVNDLAILKAKFADIDEKYNQYGQIGLITLNKETIAQISDYKKQLSEYQSSLDKLNQEIGFLKQQQETVKSLEKKIAELNDQKDLDDQIAKLLDKNGMIDYLLNSKILPQLQSSVNQVLSYVANFSLIINYDHSGIKIYKDVNGKKLDVTSLCGFERFITNIAFRLTFNKLNGKIKTDFLIIDEGFSCCDEENIDKLKALFDFIRNNYKWCLVITHLEEIKNNFDSMLFIEREDDISKIIG